MTDQRATTSESAKPAMLALADGTIFHGKAFGKARGVEDAAVGELVFNTSMYGYQEILSDPSYAGQMICFTHPHIGNVGCNTEDDESDKVHATGVIVREESPLVSNFRSTLTLSQYLESAGVLGMSGLDTRQLVTHLREFGAQTGAMASGTGINPSDLVDRARAFGSMEGKDFVREVSCSTPYTWHELPWTLLSPSESSSPQRSRSFRKIADQELSTRPHVVAIDCGVKRNILRLLLEVGFRVTVVPVTCDASEIIALRPDAIFISNGPGDPATLGYVVQTVKELGSRFPMFGICLGHQIIAQAYGAKTYKLKFGHRGGNHPVKDLTTGKVEITVQNHGFAVNADKLSGELFVSHVNLNDQTVEGLSTKDGSVFSVQYHPEASPGPHDAQYLFRRFYEQVINVSH